MKNKSTENPNLANELARIATAIEQHNTWHRRFLLGLLQGVGTVLGATIVAGTILYGMATIAEQVPWGSIIQSAIMESITNR